MGPEMRRKDHVHLVGWQNFGRGSSQCNSLEFFRSEMECIWVGKLYDFGVNIASWGQKLKMSSEPRHVEELVEVQLGRAKMLRKDNLRSPRSTTAC